MIKFLGNKLTDEQAGEEICKQLDEIIEVNNQLIKKIEDLQKRNKKAIEDGSARQATDAETLTTAFTLAIAQKMYAKGRNKEENKWEKIKWQTDPKPFVKDVETSVKKKDRAVREITKAVEKANNSYAPAIANKWLDFYKEMVAWGLDIYLEQKAWAEKNLISTAEV